MSLNDLRRKLKQSTVNNFNSLPSSKSTFLRDGNSIPAKEKKSMTKDKSLPVVFHRLSKKNNKTEGRQQNSMEVQLS